MDATSGEGSAVSVELYVRSLAPRAARDRLERVVARLTSLAETDRIEDVSVRVTGKAVPATPADAVTDYGAFLCNRVAVFREWADLTDHSIDARFERRTVHSAFTGDEYDAVVWPELVLAEYVSGDLRFVAPCERGEESVTVEDRLVALEAVTPPADRAGSPAEERVTESNEPSLERARAEPPEEFTPAR